MGMLLSQIFYAVACFYRKQLHQETAAPDPFRYSAMLTYCGYYFRWKQIQRKSPRPSTLRAQYATGHLKDKDLRASAGKLLVIPALGSHDLFWSWPPLNCKARLVRPV